MTNHKQKQRGIRLTVFVYIFLFWFLLWSCTTCLALGFLRLYRFFRFCRFYVSNFFNRRLAIEVCFALGAEFNLAIRECEECMVFTHSDILARYDARTTLAHNNHTFLSSLSLIEFRAKIFRF